MNSTNHNHDFRFTMYHHSLAGGSVQLHRNFIRKDSGLAIDQEDDEIYYRTKLRERISLDNWDYKLNRRADIGDYERIKAIEANEDICDDIRIVIERWCDNEWLPYFAGLVQIRDMTFEECICRVHFVLKVDDYYHCLLKHWERPVNFHELPISVIGALDSEVEEHCCVSFLRCENSDTNSTVVFNHNPAIPPGHPADNILATCPAVFPLHPCADIISVDAVACSNNFGAVVSAWPYPLSNNSMPIQTWTNQCPQFWWVKAHEYDIVIFQGDTITYYGLKTTWYREKVTIPSGSTPPGEGWILMNDDGTDAEFVRCPLSEAEAIGTITNFKLTQVLEHVFNGTMENCAHNGICSNLLGLNPDGVYPNNSAYQYALQYLQHLHIIAIEDAQPLMTGSGPIPGPAQLLPSEYELTFKQIYEDLKKLNIFMRFDADGKLRIEHISYFRNPEQVFELPKICAEYKYKDDEFPIRERFEYPNDASKEFLTAGIFYDMHACAEPDTTESTDLDTFDADIAFHQNQDEPIEGWLWLAPEELAGSFNLTLTNSNYEMSWIRLVPTLLAYNRPHLSGRFELENVDFETLRARRVIMFKDVDGLCCGDLNGFDPNSMIVFNQSDSLGIITEWLYNESTGLYEVDLEF